MDSQLADITADTLSALGVELPGGDRAVRTPIDGRVLARLGPGGDVDDAVERAARAFRVWREVPAPIRGQLVRTFGDELRAHKEDLARLVTLETGKILTEGRGEVQEMVDMCDLAVGLSRQLYGRTMASERPGHRMMETWHPLGPVGVISAFNFPVAVWAWNAAVALVCGDPVVWKPSERTPLTALACLALFDRAAAATGAPPDLVQVVTGGADTAEAVADHAGLPLISATGSTAMGRALAPRVAARFGRALLELGGNNAMVVTSSADLDLAVRAIVFSAAGTAGQRCTSLRRLIVERTVHDELVDRVTAAYATLAVGNPLDDGMLVGPLIDASAHDGMRRALSQAVQDGGTVIGGERDTTLAERWPEAFYVRPALVTMPAQTELVRRETFAPVLYALAVEDLDEAIAVHNDVPQGLASSIFTTDVREAERFIGAAGSDCGIANVNIGPSGAEIGGAFGGEKETGGGREAGSDAWKAYMRRATNTINWSSDLPLAQGVEFG